MMLNLHAEHFRARGDVIEIIPAYQYEEAIRIEFWDDEIEKLSIIDSTTGHTIKEVDSSSLSRQIFCFQSRSNSKSNSQY